MQQNLSSGSLLQIWLLCDQATGVEYFNPLTVRTGYIRFAIVASQFFFCKIHFLDLALTKHTSACPMSCSIYLSDLEFHQTPVAMQ